MLVYDVTNEKSFENIKTWIRNIEQHASEDVEKMVLANKCDMDDKRTVSTEQGRKVSNLFQTGNLITTNSSLRNTAFPSWRLRRSRASMLKKHSFKWHVQLKQRWTLRYDTRSTEHHNNSPLDSGDTQFASSGQTTRACNRSKTKAGQSKGRVLLGSQNMP